MGMFGVLQTMVAELVPQKEHQPRAYSIMPCVWSLGSVIGPVMGGALVMPCEAYPELFAKGTVFDTYLFLLPNLVSAGILVCGMIIGLLFLEETHTVVKSGEQVRFAPQCRRGIKVVQISRPGAPLHNEDSRAAGIAWVACPSPETAATVAFTRQVLAIILAHGILA